jgi:thiamine biosynthesis lipoprotein
MAGRKAGLLIYMRLSFRLVSGFLLLCLMLGVTATGCRSHPHRSVSGPEALLKRFNFTSPHMGTLFQITLFATNQASASAGATAAFTRIAALEDILSDYQADSELVRLRDTPVGQPVRVSNELFSVLQRSQQLSKLSKGAFDCTVGSYVRLWRFSRKRKTLPEPAESAAASQTVGYQYLRLNLRDRTVTFLRPGIRLDVGGIAKGYAADEALKVLKGRGLDRALVAASGDIAIGSPPPGEPGWKVGVTGIDSQTNMLARSLVLANAGVSTSGDSEQFIEIGGVRYSHIVDPRTGLGLTHRVQATVIGPNATTTDAAATAVCILGKSQALVFLRSLPRVEALIITRENGHDDYYASPQFRLVPSKSETVKTP